MSKQNQKYEIFITNKYLHYIFFIFPIFILSVEIMILIHVLDVSKSLYWLVLIPILGFLLSVYAKILLNYILILVFGSAISWLLIHFLSLLVFLSLAWRYSTLFGQIVTGIILMLYAVFIYFDWNSLRDMANKAIEDFKKITSKITPNKEGIYYVSEKYFMELKQNVSKNQISKTLIVNNIVMIVLLPLALFGKLAPLAGILLARHFQGTEFLISFLMYGLSIFILLPLLGSIIAYLKLKVEQSK